VGEGKDAAPENEPLNSMKAIWKRPRGEINAEEHADFYRHVSHEPGEPLRVIHYVGEGATEFRALLYIPSQAPFDLNAREAHQGVHLYVRNVLITENCRELVPEYLRFLRGVVDSNDLPLNVSREILQDDAVLRRIRKSLVAKVLAELKEMQASAPADFRKFHGIFGRAIKEGAYTEFENHDKLKDLVMFPSSHGEGAEPVLLKDYVDRMPAGQEAIYYITGESLVAASHSPHLEAFRRKGYEVLFMADPVDEWVVQRLVEYGGKRLRAVDQSEADPRDAEEKKSAGEKWKQLEKESVALLDFLRKRLAADVRDVRFSARLTESPACLVAEEGAASANLMKLLRSMNQPVPDTKRTLEINPDHPLLARMNHLAASGDEDRLGDYVDLLYGQALLAEGAPVKDPARFTRLVSELMVRAT
jgi:molecular chaperone HtpG